MSTRTRRWILAIPALYVAVTAFRAGESDGLAWGAIAAAVVLSVVFGDVPTDANPETARAKVASALALSIALATSALSDRPAWAAALREIAAAFASVVAIRTLARIEGDGGLAHQATLAADARRRGPSILTMGGATLAGAAWATAAVFDLATTSTNAAVVAAGTGAAASFALGATALLVASARRLELTAPPRALGAAGAAGVGLALAIVLSIGTKMRADAAAAVGSCVACVAIVAFSVARDTHAVARRSRRALVLLFFDGPVIALGALMAEGHLPSAAAVVIGTAIATMAIGVIADKLERPLLPVNGILLDALADAREGTRDRDPRDAMIHALLRLREAAAHGIGSSPLPPPELWVLHPPRVFTVDAAGYLREKAGEVPLEVIDLARLEPYATLRTDVLSALEVRRADLRPALKWLTNRSALFATVIGAGHDPDGMFVVPAGARTDTLTIEEARAAKAMADAFAAACQTTSAHERHLARERALASKVEDLEDEIGRLRHASSLDAQRNELAANRLARPATAGLYSAAARLAFDAIERRTAAAAPLVLVASSGIDPVGYVARAHLSGPRRRGPLVVVDGTSSREHDKGRWKDAVSSPLALANGGLLVLVDGAALPHDVQLVIARALAERRAPWERPDPLDIVLAFTAVTAPASLVLDGRLAPELFARIEDVEPITLPRLRERSEDLRTIVADRLAREGLRVRGRPVGLDASAFGRLVEHGWDGEEAELASLVTRLVARVPGDVVRAADIDALSESELPPPIKLVR